MKEYENAGYSKVFGVAAPADDSDEQQDTTAPARDRPKSGLRCPFCAGKGRWAAAAAVVVSAAAVTLLAGLAASRRQSSSGSGAGGVPRLCPPAANHSGSDDAGGGGIGRLSPEGKIFSYTQGNQNMALNKDGSLLFVGYSHAEALGANIRVPNPRWDERAQGRVDVYGWSCDEAIWTRLPPIYPTLPLAPDQGSDLFGAAVSVSDDGSTVAVGAPGNAVGSGYVQVFSWKSLREGWQVNGTWFGRDYGKSLDGLSGFGQSVALSGDGSVLVASGRNMTVAQSGGNDTAIPYYVDSFRYDGERWVEHGREITTPPAEEWHADMIVDLSGNGRCVVLSGGRLEQPALYRFRDSSWIPDETLDFSDGGSVGYGIDSWGSINHDCTKLAVAGRVVDPVVGNACSNNVVRVFDVSDPGSESRLGPDIVSIGTDYLSCNGATVSFEYDGTKVVATGTLAGGMLQAIETKSDSGNVVHPEERWNNVTIHTESSNGPGNFAKAMSGDGTVVAETRNDFVNVYIVY